MSNKNQNKKGSHMGIGLALGVVFGLALNNLGIGIALGVVFGAAVDGFGKDKQSNDTNK